MWKAFHHPDISLPVLRRALAEQICSLVAEYAEFSRAPLHWYLTVDDFDSRTAHEQAVRRLRKQGLIVGRSRGGQSTVLLTDKARGALPLRPAKHWRRRWNGIWYLLVYDVPEKERQYRDGLRRFLRQMRMGCLQGSVWVSAEDIRPQYDDLVKAAGVQAYAYLLEARTVLGQTPDKLVRNAWDMDRLHQIQRCYCEVFGINLERLRSERVSAAARAALRWAELSAYQAAFAEDPLLPKALWPRDYLGPQVEALHRTLVAELGRA